MMPRSVTTKVILSVLLCLLCGCAVRSARRSQGGIDAAAPPSIDLDRTKEAVQRLQQRYTLSTGLSQTTGWWNSANALTVLADYSRASGSTQYTAIFANTFTEAQKRMPGFSMIIMTTEAGGHWPGSTSTM